jgi:hypothetical protein
VSVVLRRSGDVGYAPNSECGFSSGIGGNGMTVAD